MRKITGNRAAVVVAGLILAVLSLGATTPTLINLATQVKGILAVSNGGTGRSTAASSHNISTPLLCPSSSGSGSTYTCSTTPTFTPAAGDELIWQPDLANTGTSATLNVNSAGAKSIAKQGGSTTTMVANDVEASPAQYLVVYDGTNWEILSQLGNAGGGAVTSVGLALPAGIFSVSGSPVTGSGTLTGSLQNQTAGNVFAGPLAGTLASAYVVQVYGCTGTASPLSCTFPAAVTPGDTVYVHAVLWANTGSYSGNPTLADSLSQTFTNIHAAHASYGSTQSYIPNGTGGTESITVTDGGGATTTHSAIILIELAGVSSSPFDAYAVHNGANDSPMVWNTSASTTNATDLIIGDAVCLGTSAGTITNGAGFIFNGSASNTNGSWGSQSLPVSSTGSYRGDLVGNCPSGYYETSTSGWKIATLGGGAAAPTFRPLTTADLPTGVPTAMNISGSPLVSPHTVIGSCVLGTSCSVTLTGNAVFTSSTSYSCSALDATSAAAIKFAPSSGSAFAFTGTGTDALTFICEGS